MIKKQEDYCNLFIDCDRKVFKLAHGASSVVRTTVVSPVIMSVVQSVKFSVAVFKSVVHRVPGDSVVSRTQMHHLISIKCFIPMTVPLQSPKKVFRVLKTIG